MQLVIVLMQLKKVSSFVSDYQLKGKLTKSKFEGKSKDDKTGAYLRFIFSKMFCVK